MTKKNTPSQPSPLGEGEIPRPLSSDTPISEEEREMLEDYVRKKKLATKNVRAYVNRIIQNGDHVNLLREIFRRRAEKLEAEEKRRLEKEKKQKEIEEGGPFYYGGIKYVNGTYVARTYEEAMERERQDAKKREEEKKREEGARKLEEEAKKQVVINE